MADRNHSGAERRSTSEFHVEIFALTTFGADVADSGIEHDAAGWRLWVETEQGDFHQFAYPTRAAAESARALFC
ncbi:MAG TPA: hypothetical protein P5256_00600 [Beijerinckiaceae bacterium]|nr:hypothetical protein [Rhodoblastus sp.]MCC2107933.1 hypothetical protein [Hyphomicrobiales bacterium]HPG04074.1 hypothetical protein [Rhodoblastus sp.]HRY01594.1 hypothetical protein [Beijerinckiaceae bacterium]